MQEFDEMLLLSDLKCFVEARALELKIPMNALLECVKASAEDWARARNASMLFDAARIVGLDISARPEREPFHEQEKRVQRSVAAPAQSSGEFNNSARFPTLRPSGPSKRITMGPAWEPPPCKSK